MRNDMRENAPQNKSRNNSRYKTKKSSKINMKRYFQVLGICFAILIVGLLGALGFGYWQESPEFAEEEIATVETEGGKINVLLLGVDEGGLRADTIMLVSFDSEAKTANLLSIPRDTRVMINSKPQKINASHALKGSNGKPRGTQGTIEAVTNLTGIPINYYIEFSFDDVAECMDLLGPVTFEIPDLYGDGVGMVYDDPVQNLHINLKPGVQELNGEQCVHLLRYRKGNLINGKRRSYPDGDIGRIAVQQKFVREVIDQKLNASLILKIPALFKQISSSVKTNFTVKDIINYSKYLDDFSSTNLSSHALPGVPQTTNKVSYWICDTAKMQELITTAFGYGSAELVNTQSPAADIPDEEDSSDDDIRPINQSSQKTDAPATQKPASTKKPTTNTNSGSDDEKPKSTQKATQNYTQPHEDVSENQSSSSQNDDTETPSNVPPRATQASIDMNPQNDVIEVDTDSGIPEKPEEE